jgi:DNA-directed RNA polymerase subunit RPC12/RpoP
MKKILRNGSMVQKKFRTVCQVCDCEFEYQLSDTTKYTAMIRIVECPECGNEILHKESSDSKLAYESVESFSIGW